MRKSALQDERHELSKKEYESALCLDNLFC
jgi:hypothetical protein